MKEALELVGQLMEIAAKTAPKAMGQDVIETKVLTEEEKNAVGNEMIRLGEEQGRAGFIRDGNNLLNADGMVLIGMLEHTGLGLNCGACGFETCADYKNAPRQKANYEGPNCIFRTVDLGIAIGSAVKTASLHNVDNRIMYSVGVAARSLGLAKGTVVIGIPLSAKGKNIFFDRAKK